MDFTSWEYRLTLIQIYIILADKWLLFSRFSKIQVRCKYSITRNFDSFKMQIHKQRLNFFPVYLYIFSNNNLNIQCLICTFMQF